MLKVYLPDSIQHFSIFLRHDYKHSLACLLDYEGEKKIEEKKKKIIKIKNFLFFFSI